ncbi:T9SS type B sorting domain-containing protein [Nonlabens antarcticus]|uniref:T9SS type B sorting domain-containing protein n=1 Tax=Nonlabens antarcticus TaxID=392714 RepID=UPI001891E143|nr:T9SS type B sorting domain-containing protein [Nonlabens antarcticus]
MLSFCLAVVPIEKTIPKAKEVTAISLNTESKHPRIDVNVNVNSADLVCPEDIIVDAAAGECGAVVRFEDAFFPGTPVLEEIVMLFDGPNVNSSPYMEKGMRLDGVGRSHIDAPSSVCENREGALIHQSTSNTWSYNDGQPFTPTRFYACSTNMRFTTGDCGTEFIPTETGEVNFPDTPEWKNITSMTWEETSGEADTSMDLFRFIPSSIKQTEGLESSCFFPVGITPVTYTATDENGVVTSCTFNVIVKDVENPIVITKNFTIALDESQLAEITIADITESLPTDNCGIESFTLSKNVFTCSNVGMNTITLTVTDVNGNITEETVNVAITGSETNSGIDPIDDTAVCVSLELPIITGSNLSGSQQYYTQPNGAGDTFEEGDVLHFSDFSSYPTTLYAFDSKSLEDCKPQTSFKLTINQAPQLDVPSPIEACDTFTFPAISGRNLSGAESYYTQPNGKGIAYNEGDVISRDAFSNYPATIYIYDVTAKAGCKEAVSFELDLTVCPMQITIITSQTEICDNDLTPIVLTAITNPEKSKGRFSYKWREVGGTTVLASSKAYEVLPENSTNYEVTVIDDGERNPINTATATLNIVVNEAPVVTAPFSIEICDNPQDGVGLEFIDLSTYNQRVSMNAANVKVSYHSTQEEADSGSNALPDSHQFSVGESIIFVRIASESTGCFETTYIKFNLNGLPEILLEPEYVLCKSANKNQPVTTAISTGLTVSNYQFSWTIDQGNGPQELEASQGSIALTEIGDYTVTVIDRNTGCSITATTSVKSGSEPLSYGATADVSDVWNSHTITATLKNNLNVQNTQYQVRLDNGLWYDMAPNGDGLEYKFQSVETGNGIHQVYFRDVGGCWSDQAEIILIGVPQFFTPNGDGFNDHWNVYGPTNLLQDSRIFIFDRYGKLLAQIEGNSAGWNGTFNGEQLPSTDYWFTVDLPDGHNFKGHFAMKR